MSAQVTVEIIEGLNEWRSLSRAWDESLSLSSSDEIFLSWNWLSTWAEEFLDKKRSLFVLIVRKDGELIGAAPWSVRTVAQAGGRIKQIESLGQPEAGSDYLDMIAVRGAEKTVASALYDFLFKKGMHLWDTAMLRDIPADSPVLLHFLSRLREDGKYVEITEGSYCPKLDLPLTEAAFVAGLSPNRRQQWRRHIRELEKKGEIQHIQYRGHDARTAFDYFFNIYEKNYRDNKLKKYLERYAETEKGAQTIQIDMLHWREQAVAGLFHLIHKDTQYMYLMAVDKEANPKISIGNILLGFVMQEAISQKRRVYDFLKGTEDYKFHWADRGSRALNLFFCRKKISSLVPVIERSVKNIAKVLVR